MQNLTVILEEAQSGNPQAAEALLPLVYEELRRLAAARMKAQPAGQTLQATALVHEAFLRLTEGVRTSWNDRTHFFRAAAEAMRCILIENARRKSRWKHGGRLDRVQLEGLQIAEESSPDALLVVHEALHKLAMADQRKADLVKLRFFVGLSNAEAAEILGVSEPTAKRDWDFARAWLMREIQTLTGSGK